jgi:hypothetical protein
VIASFSGSFGGVIVFLFSSSVLASSGLNPAFSNNFLVNSVDSMSVNAFPFYPIFERKLASYALNPYVNVYARINVV